ncbi:hypothetical protein [Sulfurimonas sp.]
MSKKYEKFEQKVQLRLILARQEQILVELRAMCLWLEAKIEEVADDLYNK